MTWFRTQHGTWINLSHVDTFSVEQTPKRYYVAAHIHNVEWVLGNRNSREECQMILDKLLTERFILRPLVMPPALNSWSDVLSAVGLSDGTEE